MQEPGNGGDWSRGRDALTNQYAPDSGAATTAHPGSSQRFGVGRVLGTGFAVWFRNLIPFLLITALFNAPPWIWAASVVHGDQTLETLRAASQALQIARFLTIPLNVFV